MQSLRCFLVLLLALGLAPSLRAGIERIDLQIEGMT